ncbi:SRPBCC domain-containing protein [Methyloglobulus sp.]|uniref:SRPBCC domain-containing protein n=1 Tax=Methyloglobulus sp. TaxID=2518622 RepID=UPI0032B79D29
MTTITVSTTISADIEKVWQAWILPEHITAWNAASDGWHCPKASNNLKDGGKFCYSMAAKDGSFSFDFEGTYLEVIGQVKIAYEIIDGRRVEITFMESSEGIKVTEIFEAEATHTVEQQQDGWQAILENFKKHVESGRPA